MCKKVVLPPIQGVQVGEEMLPLAIQTKFEHLPVLRITCQLIGEFALHFGENAVQ
jgi:hypothetical protein